MTLQGTGCPAGVTFQVSVAEPVASSISVTATLPSESCCTRRKP